jgi:hypothetical protein
MRERIRTATARPCRRPVAFALSLALFLQLATGSLLAARHLGEMVLLAELGSSICDPDAGSPAPAKPTRQMPHCECCTVGCGPSGAGAANIPRLFEIVATPVQSIGTIVLAPRLPVGESRYASDITARGPPLERT